MNADSYFAIGSTHQVCQDHVISDGNFIILSDGCSGAKDSDWGARFLTKAAYNILKQTKPVDITKFTENVLFGAKSYVDKLELHEDCLAATLLCAFVFYNHIHVFIIGDGYVIARNKQGNKLTLISHMFDTGAPWYLYYNLTDDLKRGYLTHYGHGRFIVEKSVFENDKIIYYDEQFYPVLGTNLNPIAYSFVTDGQYANTTYSFPLNEYDLVGISSDGLKSFVQQVKGNTSITNKPVGDVQAVKDLFNFKTLEGQFVHRRCQKFLRDCAAQNIKHTDDFSLGVLHV